MNLQRRNLLLGLASLGVYPVLSSSGFAAPSPLNLSAPIFVSAQGKNSNQYSLGWIGLTEKDAGVKDHYKEVLSGFRGHGVIKHPRKASTVLMFARRPGNKGVEVNLTTGHLNSAYQCAMNRHSLGHGCFSADGEYLYTAELDYQSGVGKIVVRASDSYRVVDEFNAHGVGPHEIKLMPDNKTLVIANGGIKTHPQSGRKKLNLETMRSTLTYIDCASGELVEQQRVPEAKASIRHLDVADDGTVAFGMQIQREVAGHQHVIPLAGIHRQGQAPRLCNQPEAIVHSMNDYAGSVVVNSAARLAGFTSPRGNIVSFWHIDTQAFAGYHRLHDVCGLAVTSDQKYFVMSNSTGQLRFLSAATLLEDKAKRIILPDIHWDNHLTIAS